MASWAPETGRPRVEGNVFRGVVYALAVEALLVALVYLALRFAGWNGGVR